MAYILDDKRSLGVFVVPEGNAPVVTARADTQIRAKFMIGADGTKYTFPLGKAPGAGYALVDTAGDGMLEWAESGGDPCKYEFKRVEDAGTNYNIGENDCAVEIVSDTYTSVTLPTAAGTGGKIYLISRGSNTRITLLAQPGEKIDDHVSQVFFKKHTRLTVMSNNIDAYYII